MKVYVNWQRPETIGIDVLVVDLLGVEPAALAAMADPDDEGKPDTLLGLQCFMRRVLELSLELAHRKVAHVSLLSQEAARAAGWPNAQVGNLGMLFVWALLSDMRIDDEQPAVLLMQARGKVGGTLAKPKGDYASLSMADLAAEVRGNELWMTLPAKRENRPLRRGEASGCKIIADMLRLDPRVLTERFVARSRNGRNYADDFPENAAQAGLQMLLDDVLTEFSYMQRRRARTVRLMSAADIAENGRVDTRAANITRLLAGALRCVGRWHHVDFQPPRTRMPESEELLLAAAKYAYLDGSAEATEALRALCDTNVHFGVRNCYDKTDRLLHAASKLCDPDALKRPLSIAMTDLFIASDLLSEGDLT